MGSILHAELPAGPFLSILLSTFRPLAGVRLIPLERLNKNAIEGQRKK